MTGRVRKYWKPFFNDLPLENLTRQDLKEFSIHLSKLKKVTNTGEEVDETLAPMTINHILKCGNVSLKWAAANGIITANPAEGLMKFSGASRRRGILNDDEVEKLFTIGQWIGNPANRIANILAMQTGCRAGEIVALRMADIGTDRLFIRHSYNVLEGLKSPKTNESREVPLLPETREILIEHAKLNPHGVGPQSFVFWCIDSPCRPHSVRSISNALRKAINSIGIQEAEREARNLVFHSWRHYFARKMTDALDERTAKLTGHKTEAMLQHYADHRNEDDFKKALKATSEVFGRILDFKSKTG